MDLSLLSGTLESSGGACAEIGRRPVASKQKALCFLPSISLRHGVSFLLGTSQTVDKKAEYGAPSDRNVESPDLSRARKRPKGQAGSQAEATRLRDGPMLGEAFTNQDS